MWWFQLIQEKQKLHAMQLHLQLFECISTRTVRLFRTLYDNGTSFMRAFRNSDSHSEHDISFLWFHKTSVNRILWRLRKTISVLNIALICRCVLLCVLFQGVAPGWWRPLALNLPQVREPDGRTERASEAPVRQEPWHIPLPHLLPGKILLCP